MFCDFRIISFFISRKNIAKNIERMKTYVVQTFFFALFYTAFLFLGFLTPISTGFMLCWSRIDDTNFPIRLWNAAF